MSNAHELRQNKIQKVVIYKWMAVKDVSHDIWSFTFSGRGWCIVGPPKRLTSDLRWSILSPPPPLPTNPHSPLTQLEENLSWTKKQRWVRPSYQEMKYQGMKKKHFGGSIASILPHVVIISPRVKLSIPPHVEIIPKISQGNSASHQKWR